MGKEVPLTLLIPNSSLLTVSKGNFMANVRFENITVGYGDHMVLKDFSLEVESGQIV